MNDYYATLKIQQGRLKAAMMEMGIHTVAELAKRSGITQGQIGKLINFNLMTSICSHGLTVFTPRRSLRRRLMANGKGDKPRPVDHKKWSGALYWRELEKRRKHDNAANGGDVHQREHIGRTKERKA